MSVIVKLTDEDFGIEKKEMNNFDLRLAARGIIVRDDGKIALQNNRNNNEFKLIGGGIEKGEDPCIAFQREALEEAGCEVDIVEQLGTAEEYKSLENVKQISYIFVAKVINDKHSLNLTEREIAKGAQLLWVEPKEALKLITNCYDKLLSSNYKDEYNIRFIVLRDRKLLEYYLKNMKKMILSLK